MQFHYFPTPESVPIRKTAPDVAIVIDVLRATTTIGWALHNGATAIHTFSDLNKLQRAAILVPEAMRILAGERRGQQLEGFDLGNSPVAVTSDVVGGKRIFLSTTNGTRALQSVRKVPKVFTCSLNNRKAVARELKWGEARKVWVVGSGWEGAYSLEDSLGAGALVMAASDGPPENSCANDEMVAAAALWEVWEADPEACLRLSSHGRRLQALGNHDADFRCCAAVDSLNVVPTQDKPGVLTLV